MPCPNKDCTTGCAHCKVAADTCPVPLSGPCNMNECLTKCQDPKCTSAPCTAVVAVCRTSPAAEVCAEEKCPEAVPCDDEACDGLCDDPCCDDPCGSTSCADQVCEEDACVGAQKTLTSPCMDYGWCPGSNYDPPFPKQQIQYHIHDANANRWHHQQQPQHHHQMLHSGYAHIAPNTLHFTNDVYQPQQFHYHGFGEQQHHHQQQMCQPQMPTPRITPQPSVKRRKLSTQADASSGAESPEQAYISTAPTSVEHTPGADPVGDMCLFDLGCDFHFEDQFSLQNHLHQSHKRALDEAVCRWDGCGQQATDAQSLVNHIQLTHAHAHQQRQQQYKVQMRPERMQASVPVRHVCLWAGCSATFQHLKDLQNHLHVHTVEDSQRHNPVHCEWDDCSLEAQSALDIEKHVKHDHLRRISIPDLHIRRPSVPDLHMRRPSIPELDIRRPSIPEVKPPVSPITTTPISPTSLSPWTPESTTATGIRVCEWQEVDAAGNLITCGKEFHDAAGLQEHAKKEHITELKKKTGYYCRWASCLRKDKPFSQKGKVERHLQTHTGCTHINLWSLKTLLICE